MNKIVIKYTKFDEKSIKCNFLLYKRLTVRRSVHFCGGAAFAVCCCCCCWDARETCEEEEEEAVSRCCCCCCGRVL